MRRQVLAIGLAATVSACGNLHHNDVLIFGTETKIALDVSAAPTAGGAPSVTLGYKRSEAVWMPLLVNGRQSEVVAERTGATAGARTSALADAKYRSSLTRQPGGGSKVTQEDAYSVFASFGAKLGGNATGAGAEGKVGLAQFFATGNAAINVSENEALVTALKVDDAGSSRAQAAAVTAAAQADPAAVAAGEKEATDSLSRLALIRECLSPATGGWRWTELAPDLNLNNPQLADADSWEELRLPFTADEDLQLRVLQAGAARYSCNSG